MQTPSTTNNTPGNFSPVRLLLAMLALVSMGVALALGRPLAFNPQSLLIWLVLLAAFWVHEFVHYPANGASWLGLRGIAVMLAAMLLGGVGAALLLILGLVGTWVIAKRQQNDALARILVSGALGGVPLLVWVLLPVTLPAAPLLVDSLWIALVGALVVAWATVQLVGGALLAPRFDISPIWQRGGRTAEAIAVTQVIPLAIVAQEAGAVVFALMMIGVTIATVMENRLARRENTLEQRATEISEITELGRRLSAHLLLDNLLSELQQMMQRALPSRVLAVALYNPDAATPVLQYVLVTVDGQRGKEGYYALQPNSVEALALADVRVLHLSAGTWPTDTPLVLQVVGMKCVFAVPLRKGDTLTGLLVLADDNRMAFTPGELELAETIAGQVGMTIENARLYTSRARLVDNLAAINSSMQTLLFNLDSDEAVQIICQTAMQITQADRAAVYIKGVENPQLELVHAINLPASYASETRSVEHLTIGEAHIIHDTYLGTDYNLRALSDLGGFRAFAETPLITNNMIVGMLAVYHENPYDYPATEVDLLQVLANQITVALENADLLRALEMYAAEMAQLVHLSRSSLISLHPGEVATTAADTLRQMFNVSSAIIAVVTPVQDGNEVITILGQAPTAAYTPNRHSLMLYPELKALRDRLESPRQVLYLDDPETSRGMRLLMSRNNQRTVATVPMFSQGDMFGVVLLGTEAHRNFTPREWQFIETATNLTAAQIQNAILHRDTQDALLQRLEQLGYIERLAQQISSSLDVETIIDSVFEATYAVTQAETITLAQADGDGRFRVIRRNMVDGDENHEISTVAELGGALAETYDTGERVLSAAYGLPDDINQTPMLGQYPSILAVPLLQEGRVLGVLCAESNNRAFFNDQQAEFLRSLSGHIVISIANARLLEERQSQVEALNQLRQLSLEVVRAGNRFAVAEHILETTVSLLGGDGLGVYHIPPDAERPMLIASSWRSAEPGMAQTLVPPQLAPQDIAAILDENRVQVRYDRDPHGQHRTLVLIPIVRGENTRALLMMSRPGHSALSTQDTERIDLLADHAASYLENIILYEQVNENSNRTRAILESTHDGVILLDRQGRLLDYNTPAEKLFGIDMAEWLRRPFDELPLNYTTYTRDDLPREMMEEAERNGNNRRERQRSNLKLERGPDDIVYLERTDLPVYDAQERVMGSLLVLRDITEDMELANYRDEITYMLVHDLRSPLGSVISGLNFAEELAQDDKQTPVLMDVLGLASHGANRLMNLIDTLLDVERSQMTLIPELWDIGALIDSASTELAQAAQEVNIRVTKKIADDIPPLQVDGDKLQRVLINLIDNAIDYSIAQVHVSVRRADQNWVEVRVNDDGPGVPVDKRQLVFTKFAQANNQEDRRTKHTGIGLAYCRRAVEAHGGKIWLADDTDTTCTLSGACFVFCLPIAGLNPDGDPTL
jgi:PAS domain S-box-containing protein